MRKNIIFLSLMLAVALTACVTIPLGTGKQSEDTDSTPVAASPTRYNLLVAGTDRASGLTDVIMLVSVDKANKTACVLQIPRDTYAEYTGKSYKKLNGAYGALGAEGFCEFLGESLGVTVDGYLVLSPDAFCGAVDALGGVEIILDRPMRYSDPEQGLYISLDAGKQRLDGKSAEHFVRYRSGYEDGDLGRMDAQRLFLCALYESAEKSASPATLLKLTAALLGKTDTNITPAEGASLAECLLSMDGEDITLLRAAGEAVVAETSGASYYSLSRGAMSEIVEKYLGGSADGFDRGRVFLNEKYEGFRRVYEGYSPYDAETVKNIGRAAAN